MDCSYLLFNGREGPPKIPHQSPDSLNKKGAAILRQPLCNQVVGEAGLEPTTPGLEGRCSIQLSYSPVLSILALIRACV